MKLRLEDRRSDIIAARDAWQKDYDTKMAAYDAQEKEYDIAISETELFLEDQVKTIIGRTTLDDLEIKATAYGGNFGSKSYGVKVGIPDWGLHDEGRSLTWRWEVALDSDGNVTKSTGSWSGLNAVTSEQMDHLEESVRILKILNNIDWKTMLDKMETIRPKYKDYVTLDRPKDDRYEFDKQMKQATIDDAIGQKILVLGYGNQTGGRDGSYYAIHKQTPKQTSVTEFAKYNMSRIPEGADIWDYITKYGIDYRISTDKFMKLISNNPETMDLR